MALVPAIALVKDTFDQAQDFRVFWTAAKAVLHGLPAYDVGRDAPMVFKYPPWILAAFFPFSLFPLKLAKLFWGLTELGSLIYVVRHLKRRIHRAWILYCVLVLYWGIWAVHFLDGQIVLPVLAIVLAASSRLAGRPAAAAASMVWALTAKVFTGIAIFSFRWWRFPKRAFVCTGVCLVLLSIPVLLTTPGQSPLRMLQDWRHAAASGGETMSEVKIWGRDNQGFPAMILRNQGVTSAGGQRDVFVAALLTLVFGLWWGFRSRYLEGEEKLAGWLAVSAMVHPLAWFHLFALTFPLAVLSIDRSYRSRRRAGLALSVAGAVLIAAVTRKTLGESYGYRLEMMSIKSWGTLLCLFGLLYGSKPFLGFDEVNQMPKK